MTLLYEAKKSHAGILQSGRPYGSNYRNLTTICSLFLGEGWGDAICLIFTIFQSIFCPILFKNKRYGKPENSGRLSTDHALPYS